MNTTIRLLGAFLITGLALSNATKSTAQTEGWLVEGNQSKAHLGQTVTTAGDVNGDSYDDLLIGGRFDFGDGGTGVAYAYYGSSQGLATVPDWTGPNDQPNQYTFLALDGAGDVNGDGYDDVIAGDSHYTDDELEEGRAYLFYGSANGLGNVPAWVVHGNQRIMYFGTDVAGVGDVNGDGYDDVLVGAPYKRDADGNVIGQALLYFGSPTGLGSTPAWTVEGAGGWSYFAQRLSPAGDVNADGYADFMVSDTAFTNQHTAEGRVFLYLGSPNGPAFTPSWTADGGQDYASFGGATNPAGDVNGDGYDDVIIGATGFGNPESNEGQARLYLGSPNGLSQSPAWTVESNQSFAYLGNAVGSAGDVNHDGFDDVVVGAYAFYNGQLSEGRAFLYLGSTGGLAAEPAWMAEGDQDQANFGGSVGSAGDTNRDGSDEWVVGAPQYDRGETDEGIAVLFSSLSTGPLPTPIPVTPPTPTPTPQALQMHISDLDASASSVRNTWTARVTVEVRASDGTTLSQASVSGNWSTGSSSQCTTGSNGRCTIQLSGLAKKVGSVIFTISNVQHGQDVYQPSANTDPDGDSNGTSITIQKP